MQTATRLGEEGYSVFIDVHHRPKSFLHSSASLSEKIRKNPKAGGANANDLDSGCYWHDQTNYAFRRVINSEALECGQTVCALVEILRSVAQQPPALIPVGFVALSRTCQIHTGAMFFFPGHGLITLYLSWDRLKGLHAMALEHRLGHCQKITGNIRFRARQLLDT